MYNIKHNAFTFVVETNPASLWPSIPVKMPKPVDGCPTDFQEFAASYIVNATIITPTPSTIEWNQGSTSKHFEESYCLKTETSGGLGKWGQGQYCIEKVDGVGCEGGNSSLSCCISVQLKRSCQLHNYNQIFYPQFIVMQLKS